MGTPAPRRLRSGRWRPPFGYAVVAFLTVAAVAGFFGLRAVSDVHATTSQTASLHARVPRAPSRVPGRLAPIWRASSPKTPEPVAVEKTVVTAGNHEVAGRDPATGKIRWRYARSNLALCTVSAAWQKVLALYQKNGWCGEVTSLDAVTGERGAQRTGNVELGTRLVDGGAYVTATGPSLLDTWRSDLVLTDEYGDVPDPVTPGAQPRPDCTYGSVAAGGDRIGVIERCPGDRQNSPADRLTVFNAHPKDRHVPEVIFSTVLAGPSARVVAVNGDYAAVALGGKLVVYADSSGKPAASYPLSLPTSDLRGDPPGRVVPTTTPESGDSVYWFTGSATVALAASDLHPRWSVPRTKGSGTLFAGRLLLPVAGALAVVDQDSGRVLRRIPVDRHGYRGPVGLDALGPVVLEQRGATLVVLE
jgi:hypothetical protein